MGIGQHKCPCDQVVSRYPKTVGRRAWIRVDHDASGMPSYHKTWEVGIHGARRRDKLAQMEIGIAISFKRAEKCTRGEVFAEFKLARGRASVAAASAPHSTTVQSRYTTIALNEPQS